MEKYLLSYGSRPSITIVIAEKKSVCPAYFGEKLAENSWGGTYQNRVKFNKKGKLAPLGYY